MIRVLFIVRPDLYRIQAGDTIQILNLSSALIKLGLSVTVVNKLKPDIEDYDIIHCFNLLRVDSSYTQCMWVKDKGKKLLLTPIYWNIEEYLIHVHPDQLEWWKRNQARRMEVLKKVDLLLPNAELERQQIVKDFKLDLPYKIIYNGVDPLFYNESKIKRKMILCVGRIHPRKNQLNLIKALKGTNLPLNFVGDINDYNYYRKCLKAASGENISFLGKKKIYDLIKLYQLAKVHVLPSWYDTPGLVNLEAGLSGCNLVTTERGSAREYLNNYALYCEPDNLNDIRNKVITAYYRKRNNALQNIILNRYSWAQIAEQTLKIYSEFLS